MKKAIIAVLLMTTPIVAIAYLGSIINGANSNSSSLSTADKYIAAYREYKTIQPDTRALPKISGKMELDDCRADKLNPYTDHPVSGTVIRVIDGDTLRVSIEGFEMPVRLWGIDALEMDQPNGPKAREKLEALVPKGSRVKVYPVSKDYYDRMVAVVDNGNGQAVNFNMVARGWAYHHPRYDPRRRGCLASAERAARDSRMGLWRYGTSKEDPPWERRWGTR